MTVIVHTPAELAALSATSRTIGLVPTMGALHEGHLSLMRRANVDNDLVVVSIFVNPTQFNDPSDLVKYPRSLERDAELAATAGVDAIYAPEVSTIYPDGFATTVTVSGVTDLWEGESRPGHFAGVATVVSILLNQVRPDRAYFGEKDYQQLAMVRRMRRDLSLPGQIVPCPIVREPDGLAMSSRNVRLATADRAVAPVLYEALSAMRESALAGETSALRLAIAGAVLIRRVPAFTIDYLNVVNPDTLEPLDILVPGARAIVAATIGGVRLIDNLELIPGNAA